MMLRVNNEYLDFNQSIEQDRKARLFESIDEIEGDVSFEFEIELTSENALKLGFPYPDSSSKTVYHKVTANLENNEGQLVSKGFIKVERKIGKTLFCSFFGGNSNWFASLTGNMTDLRLSQYDVEQTEANITASWTATNGIVWPILDAGTLSTRSYYNLKTEDFIPCFYVKTLMFEVFQQSGIKLAGEILDDWIYNNMVVAANDAKQDEINASSTFAQKTTTTERPIENTDYKVTFQNDSQFPFYDGANDNFDLANSRWIAPYKCRIELEASFVPSIIDASYNNRIYIYINGVFTFVDIGLDVGGLYNTGVAGDQSPFSIKRTLQIESGDIIEIYSDWQQSTGSTQNDILSGSLKITPLYIYNALGSSSVPKWTKQQFVSQVLAIFNVIPAFDPFTKTLTLNLFDKIKSKEPIDISEFIEEPEVDYSEFISDYGRKNNFSYQETNINNLNELNIYTFIKYGAGIIEASNDFIEESVEVLESDFAAPITYLNGVFDMSMERIDFIDYGTEETEITSVTGPGFSIARFNVAADIFEVNDLVRISESTNESYNGDWVVQVVGTGYIQCLGPVFDTDATAKIEKLLHRFTSEDNVYLFINIPNYDLNDASGGDGLFYINQNFVFSAAIAYFNLLNTGNQINIDYKQGLSFGETNNVLSYQRTILQTYWNTFGRILNDPVKLKANAYLPWKIHNDIDFLRPLIIKTLETSNLYYCNMERGYQNSYTSCELHLIKLP